VERRWWVQRSGVPGVRALAVLLGACVMVVGVAGCSGSQGPSSSTAGAATGGPSGSGDASPGRAGARKVILIVEENEEYASIVGSPAAPRINDLADRFGLATNVDAGYPTHCPSLAAYLILTSGDRHGVCDDRNPGAHPLPGDNLYQQVADAGLEYRQYAESMPTPCLPVNSPNQGPDNWLYLVRHAPVPYYTSEAQRCPQWDIPLGTLDSGALHDAVTSGDLPSFSFITPNACNDMHGAPVCGTDAQQRITAGDTWLGTWLDQIMAGPDYTSGTLTILVTWDEGSATSNHLPTIVISPTTSAITSATPYTHCSTLRTIEDLLGLAPLGCAATATSLVQPFGLA
jgi:hypothetical protein